MKSEERKEVLFKESTIGVKLSERGFNDSHILFSLLIEDDDSWHETTFNVSSSFIDETIKVLKKAKKYMEKQTKDVNFGYKF